MKLEREDRNGLTVITLATDKLVLANADEFKSQMVDIIRQGGHRLVLDCSGVETIDSRGLGVLISVMKSLGPDGAMALCGLTDHVRKVFGLTKLDQVFSVYEDRESAMEALSRA
ncbi:MAG: anti-sigma factor antagonist [Deltaproteobacteria bacterium]|nr:anti-sigma factor antagonist [Deltaproteobacteria bacterium]